MVKVDLPKVNITWLWHSLGFELWPQNSHSTLSKEKKKKRKTNQQTYGVKKVSRKGAGPRNKYPIHDNTCPKIIQRRPGTCGNDKKVGIRVIDYIALKKQKKNKWYLVCGLSKEAGIQFI